MVLLLIYDINRLISSINGNSWTIIFVDAWFGRSTCDPLAASCLACRWVVWSVNLRPAGSKLPSLDVYRLLGTDEWFCRSTCGPPAASCPPFAYTNGLAINRVISVVNQQSNAINSPIFSFCRDSPSESHHAQDPKRKFSAERPK